MKIKARNQSMEVCKLTASFFVVFIHACFPGNFGNVVRCLARFAVPVFLAISGFFNYQTKPDKINKRFVHILKLNAIAFLVHVLWDCFVTEYTGGSTVSFLRSLTPKRGWLVSTFLLLEHPFYEYQYEHLWYLLAIGICYMLLGLYVRFFREAEVNYHPLYIAGFCAYMVFVLLEEIAAACNAALPFQMTINVVLYAMPLFVLGIFIREYHEKIVAAYQLTFPKLSGIVAIGMLISVFEEHAVGSIRLYIGTVVAVVALMLLMAGYPKVAVNSRHAENIISRLGNIAMWIYIVHIIVLRAYEMFLLPTMAAAFADKEAWLRPIAVLTISLLVSVLCERMQCLLIHFRKKTA